MRERKWLFHVKEVLYFEGKMTFLVTMLPEKEDLPCGCFGMIASVNGIPVISTEELSSLSKKVVLL